MKAMNMAQIRNELSEAITELRAKTITPKEMNAIVNAVGKYLFSVKLELEYAKMKGGIPALPALESK